MIGDTALKIEHNRLTREKLLKMAKAMPTTCETKAGYLAVRGHSNKKIGELLGITEATVKVYLYRLFIKLGVSSRTELTVLYWRNGCCLPKCSVDLSTVGQTESTFFIADGI